MSDIGHLMVEVRGGNIIVSLSGSIYAVTYYKPSTSPQLLAKLSPPPTELYALRHNDVTVADEPKRLILTVRNGKTGFRADNLFCAPFIT
jgi:hypothetical protein